MLETPKDKARGMLVSIEKRMKPAVPPWRNDPEVFDYWVELVMRYTDEQVSAAFAAHLGGGQSRWPNYYTFRDLLRNERRKISNYQPAAPAEDCDICSNTGWQQAECWQNQRGHIYHQVRPCSCYRGFETEKSPIWQDQIERNQTTNPSTGSLTNCPENANAKKQYAWLAELANASTNSSSEPF